MTAAEPQLSCRFLATIANGRRLSRPLVGFGWRRGLPRPGSIGTIERSAFERLGMVAASPTTPRPYPPISRRPTR
jgi:hypothetical protein